MNLKTRLLKLEKLNIRTDWNEVGERMNKYFEGSGIGLRYECGTLEQRPELWRPAPNRNVEDFS